MNAGCAGRSAQKSSAVDARIRALGGTPICYSDPADVAVDKIVAAVNPSGLHFAFLDPYNLEGLSFDIIRKLSKLKVDMLIHVSVQDLQRNLDDYSKQGGVFDTFAPGWKAHVNPNQAINSFRAALMKYWMGETARCQQKAWSLSSVPRDSGSIGLCLSVDTIMGESCGRRSATL